MKADRDFRLILNKIYNRESLVGSDLRNLYFSCMDLRHANFEGARLSHGVLDRSDLTNANFADVRA